MARGSLAAHLQPFELINGDEPWPAGNHTIYVLNYI